MDFIRVVISQNDEQLLFVVLLSWHPLAGNHWTIIIFNLIKKCNGKIFSCLRFVSV